MLPTIRKAVDTERSRADEEASYLSLQICRIFAGLEETLGNGDPDALLPLFAPLIFATTTCPTDCRTWLWYKLNHFEKLAHLTFDPVKRNLAVMWDMPQIVSESSPPPIISDVMKDIEPRLRALEVEEIGDGEDVTGDPHINTARGLPPRIA